MIKRWHVIEGREHQRIDVKVPMGIKRAELLHCRGQATKSLHYPSQAPASPDQKRLGTPSRSDHSRDENVTKRSKGTPRSLAFNTLTEHDPKPTTEDDQVIDALNDMDITDKLDGGLMDCEMQNDDLMGLELAEMEDKKVRIGPVRLLIKRRRSWLVDRGGIASMVPNRVLPWAFRQINLRFFFEDLHRRDHLRLL
ncbi:hypothetical protein DY000_02030490 [Brassica cretica]|nr:hypothetical protein DY000_02030490 [Brassica cretica]